MQPGARRLAWDERPGACWQRGQGTDAAGRYRADTIGCSPLVVSCVNSPQSLVLSSCSKREEVFCFRGLHTDSNRSWISVA